MIKLSFRRQKMQPAALTADQTNSDGPATDARYLAADKRHNARRPISILRLVGNLLIAVGVLMLLGIGGWWGYTTWQNQQDEQSLVSRFGPGVLADAPPQVVAPTATPLVPAPPPPVLNSIGGQMVGVAAQKPQPDDSPPVRITIPGVGIDSKIVPVTWKMIPSKSGEKSEWQVADYAVGHHQGTANPGQPGNVVLSGHVDYRGEVFKNLHLVNKGDEVVIHTEKGQYLYVVTDLKIVLEDGATAEQKARNARLMDPTPDPTLTLITCYPYGIDNYRLVVIAKPYQSSLSSQSEFSIR